MIEENKIGADIFAELKAKKYCSIKKIINWLYFTETLKVLMCDLISCFMIITLSLN